MWCVLLQCEQLLVELELELWRRALLLKILKGHFVHSYNVDCIPCPSKTFQRWQKLAEQEAGTSNQNEHFRFWRKSLRLLVREKKMKTYKNLIEKALSDEIMDEAFRVAIKRKRLRPDVSRIINNYEKTKEKLKEFILTGEFTPFVHKAVIINDGFKLKKRAIIQPFFSPNRPEQWIQHIVVQVLKPIFMRGMYEFSCGSVPGRGVHYGKKYIEKFLKNNPKSAKYVLKLDIHHFYENVSVDLIKERLNRTIKDEKMLKLIYFVLDSNIGVFKDSGEIFRPGLPIGFYTSQWFANWFLQPLDHYIKEELKAAFYVRYMDDIVIFGSNKRKLHKDFIKIQEYLKTIRLEVKGNWQVFRFDYIDKNGKRQGRPVDFMGFKFYRDKTTIRKTIFLRACRLARRLKKKMKISWYDACRLLSYLGWFCATDTFAAYKRYIEPCVNVDACKIIVSKHSTKEEKCKSNTQTHKVQQDRSK